MIRKLIDLPLLKLVINEDIKSFSFTNDNKIYLEMGTSALTIDGANLIVTLKKHINEHCNDLSTNKTFYIQTNGREWYAGFCIIKTTYDDKATLQHVSKGDSELEALLKYLISIRTKKDIKNMISYIDIEVKKEFFGETFNDSLVDKIAKSYVERIELLNYDKDKYEVTVTDNKSKYEVYDTDSTDDIAYKYELFRANPLTIAIGEKNV